MAAIILAHVVAVGGVGAVASERFDPGMLVGRHGLRGELTADPVGLLGHDYAHAVAKGGERGGAPTHATPEDGDIAGKLARARGCGERRGKE